MGRSVGLTVCVALARNANYFFPVERLLSFRTYRGAVDMLDRDDHNRNKH